MNTIKDIRHLTICRFVCDRQTYMGSVAFPELRLRGKWLLDAGFRSGQIVSVTCLDRKLIIEPVSEPGNGGVTTYLPMAIGCKA